MHTRTLLTAFALLTACSLTHSAERCEDCRTPLPTADGGPPESSDAAPVRCGTPAPGCCFTEALDCDSYACADCEPPPAGCVYGEARVGVCECGPLICEEWCECPAPPPGCHYEPRPGDPCICNGEIICDCLDVDCPDVECPDLPPGCYFEPEPFDCCSCGWAVCPEDVCDSPPVPDTHCESDVDCVAAANHFDCCGGSYWIGVRAGHAARTRQVAALCRTDRIDCDCEPMLCTQDGCTEIPTEVVVGAFCADVGEGRRECRSHLGLAEL